MKSDRDLLELAAKAAGMPIELISTHKATVWSASKNKAMSTWNAIDDDGDAFRLAVKLGMSVCVDNDGGITRIRDEYLEVILVCRHEPRGADAATRRAIVRVAASIGEAMR